MQFDRAFFKFFLLCLFCVGMGLPIQAQDNPFLGYWSLHLPGNRAGWLAVETNGNQLKAEMLWATGSVLPLSSVKMVDGQLVVTRLLVDPAKFPPGLMMTNIETITITSEGDALKLASVLTNTDGTVSRSEFSGYRQAPLPPAPDLSQVTLGAPIQLFNGTNLDGWQLVETNAVNGWLARNGILVNLVLERGLYRPYGNLRTVAEFKDFSLHAETRVPKGGNSGIYLRGTDEVQVYDTFGKPLDSHNMGAIYSRIQPTVSAEKPAGTWQTLDILYVDQHVTVVLNGIKIIDNQPVLGPTGGALWPEMDWPGPIYLQGDHTSIEFRNLVLRPVVKK